MKIITQQLNFKTKGAGDLVDITARVQKGLEDSGLQEGNVTVFVIGSTAAITTLEYEPGLICDLKELYEELAPSNKAYAHDRAWGDANGFSHLRAALQGPSLVVPFVSAGLILGTWQQVVLAEFDNKPRQRKIVLQFTGE